VALGSSPRAEPITGINVTPLVDVVLVLLVVLMVTATYLASRSIPLDLPRATTGEVSAAPLTVSLDLTGGLFLDGSPISEDQLRRRLVERRGPDLRVVIAADGGVPHRRVIHILDLLRREKVSRFALNVSPLDLHATTP
jgi:biopolymer transport protein ExbD